MGWKKKCHICCLGLMNVLFFWNFQWCPRKEKISGLRGVSKKPSMPRWKALFEKKRWTETFPIAHLGHSPTCHHVTLQIKRKHPQTRVNDPASNSNLTTQIVSMLMVHEAYVFKLWLQPFQNWRERREEKRWNICENLTQVQLLTEIKLWITTNDGSMRTYMDILLADISNYFP